MKFFHRDGILGKYLTGKAVMITSWAFLWLGLGLLFIFTFPDNTAPRLVITITVISTAMFIIRIVLINTIYKEM